MLAVLDLRIVVACHIDLAPNDRFDLEMPGRLVHVLIGELEELLDSVHVTVVCDGQGRHPHLLGPVKQSGNRGETVKNRVLCVDVKVNKSHGDKSIFNHQNKPPGIRLFHSDIGRIATIQRYRKTLSPQSRPPRKVINTPEKVPILPS